MQDGDIALASSRVAMRMKSIQDLQVFYKL